jgi:hypothetical protein
VASNSPTLSAHQFGGLFNKIEPQELGLDGFTQADNLNIDGSGRSVFARRGQTQINSTPYRGAYATPDKKCCYAVTAAGVLENWAGAGAAMRSGFVGYPYWTQIADIVFAGNESQIWRITPDGQVADNAITQPPSPQLTAVTGALPAGQYRFVVVGVSAGRESAPSISAIITVDGTQDIQVSGIFGQRLYVAPANANGFYWWRDPAATALVYAGVTAEALGEELRTLDLDPMPAGRCLAEYQQRLYVAQYDARVNESTVYSSFGNWWDICDTFEHRRTIPGEVRAMAGHKDGLLIATDRQILMLANDTLTALADYGVPPGQPIAVDRSGQLWIATRKGFCSALPFAEVTPHFDLPDADWTGSAVLRQDGDERLVVTLSPFGLADNIKPVFVQAVTERLTEDGLTRITEDDLTRITQ